MKKNSHTHETLVIKTPSKVLVDLMDKLRDKKMTQQEELCNKKEFYFSKKK